MEHSFEHHLKEVESIVKSMESGSLSLDDSIKAYEKGMKAIHLCQTFIAKAESSFKILETKLSGEFREKDLDEYEKPLESGTVASKEPRKKTSKSDMAKSDSVDLSPKPENLNLFD